MIVTVENGRAVQVRGDPEHPESRGVLCPKGRAALEILYAPDRLKEPLKRVGKRGEGLWEPISWEDALDWIGQEFEKTKQRFGPEAVAFHKGSGHDLCAGDIRPYLQRLASAFGTPNTSSPFYICNGPRTLNLFHTTGSIPAPDVEKASCVVAWGLNPAASAINRHRRILEAKKRGAKLIVVDPRKTTLARQSDIHVQPRPGTDCALALGILRVIVEDQLFDEGFVQDYTVGFDDLQELLADYPPNRVSAITWVPEEKILEVARTYGGCGPGCVFLGQALDQHTNASNTIRAIACLISITGNLDVPGGNVIYPTVKLGKRQIEMFDSLPEEIQEKRLGQEYLLSRFPFTRIAHPPTVFDAILTGRPYPVRSLLVMASNPALVEPSSETVSEALLGLDFLVVVDLFMTETARLSDLVLPSCTFLEDTYYATYETGAYLKPAKPGLLQLRPKVVEPVGESKTDWQIIVDLAHRLGVGEHFPWTEIEEAIDYELRPTGITVSALRAQPNGIQLPAPSFLYQKLGEKGPLGRLLIRLLSRTVFRKFPDMYRKYRRMPLMTPSGKVELRSSVFEEAGLDPLPVYREPAESPISTPERAAEFPLVLSTGAKTRHFVHSQFHNIPRLSKAMPRNLAEMHPETAASAEVEAGATVLVETIRGAIECVAKVTSDILPGVVQLFHGFVESNANRLTDDRNLDPATGSAPMRSGLCRVTPVGASEKSRPEALCH
jgi:anaerobic selenocysteine-containing dehydrogenase